jgi:2-oxoglutarate dehydrogenase E1 component
MTAAQTNPGMLRAAPDAINAWSPEYIEHEYQRFLSDPASVPGDLAAFFRGFELASSGISFGAAGGGGASQLDLKAFALVQAYRTMGHAFAKLDPLGRHPLRHPSLEPSFHGISAGELSQSVSLSVIPGKASATVAELIAFLESVYCGSIGAEFMYAEDPREREFFLARLERCEGAYAITDADRIKILDQLISGESLDKFLGKRYQGKKRFSGEGCESVIPLLLWMTDRAAELGAQEVIMGMAHRARLAVLKCYLQKEMPSLLTEFEESWIEPERLGFGDVKYHRGHSCDYVTPSGKSVHLSMLNNPSHLETVNPVVLGRVRAKQDQVGDTERTRILSLILHGDAAMSGQGVVYECAAMSGLEGYNVGGTIHIATNNQIGFTTDPVDGRSSRYCTDVAKVTGAPVLHVNGDDPEAVVAVARMVAEYRAMFKREIYVDLVCFRRYGHNEQDEPRYTQPTVYARADQHAGVPANYRRKLVGAGVLSDEAAQAIVDRESAMLDAAQDAAKKQPVNPANEPGKNLWKGFTTKYSFESPKTGVSMETLKEVAAAMGRTPEGFNVHPKLKALLAARANLPAHGKIAHADAEQLAIGTLLVEGYDCRISGQDVRRGTFTHRHAALRDEQTGERYMPLANVRAGKQGAYTVFDSLLSEYAVMGFDYGYSRGAPRCLVMWEAQFGDFCNGAQIIIDQFLASSEVKWNRWSGMVLLLPHGQEGQGPEHTSARLERFLSLCGNDSMEVVAPTTGAQIFHLLRRQMLRNFRKPLVVMTPKRFLRVETSTIEDLVKGEFQHLIDDPMFAGKGADTKNVSRVIYCMGKIYHELAEKRDAAKRTDTALVRVEQMYPFHADLAKRIDARYPAGAKRVWAQEEPRNSGAFLYIADAFREKVGVELAYAGRAACASPAGGSEKAYKLEQERVIGAILGSEGATNGNHAPEAKPEPKGAPAKAKR